MSVPFTKVFAFAADVGNKVHNLGSDTIFVSLTNTAPTTGTTAYTTTGEPTTGGGYTAGGATIGTHTFTQTGGVATLTGTNVVFTATTGFGPFRYALVYNSTAAGKNAIGFWDYGSSISLGASETFTVDLTGNILTLT